MPTPHIHRGYLPGCIGRVAEIHAAFYHPLVGFGVEFEAKVASELATFCLQYEAAKDGLWLAVHEGRIEGSIAIEGRTHGARVAHLRWFILSQAVRGAGAGKLLLKTALDFCQAADCEEVHLWTFDRLPAARHLYERSGFNLAEERRGAQWGAEVNEQRFVLRLA